MRIRQAAFGPLFRACEGVIQMDFRVKSWFVIPLALPAVLRYLIFRKHRDSGLIRIRRKSAFSRLGIVTGGLVSRHGDQQSSGSAKSRQRPSLHRVTTNQNRSYTSTNSPRFQAVSEADSELLFPFVASGVATVETQCVAMHCSEWLQVVL